MKHLVVYITSQNLINIKVFLAVQHNEKHFENLQHSRSKNVYLICIFFIQWPQVSSQGEKMQDF